MHGSAGNRFGIVSRFSTRLIRHFLPRFLPRLLPTLICLPVFVVLVSLGNWQLERMVWKQDLIDRMQQRQAATRIALPAPADWPLMSAANDEYRRVTLSGNFLHQFEQYWFTHNDKAGPGVEVITPFALATGGTVLVNRGFVPMYLKDPQTRSAGQVSGNLAISGLLHWPGERKMFDPPDEPENNFWFVRDLEAMAANIGLQVAPFFVDSDRESGFPGGPQGGQTRVNLPNRHLEYVITWYGLALALVIVYGLWHIRRPESKAE